MLQQPSFDHERKTWENCIFAVLVHLPCNLVLTSFSQNEKIEVDAFFFSSGDGSSGKDQPFIVAQHEGTR